MEAETVKALVTIINSILLIYFVGFAGLYYGMIKAFINDIEKDEISRAEVKKMHSGIFKAALFWPITLVKVVLRNLLGEDLQ